MSKKKEFRVVSHATSLRYLQGDKEINKNKHRALHHLEKVSENEDEQSDKTD